MERFQLKVWDRYTIFLIFLWSLCWLARIIFSSQFLTFLTFTTYCSTHQWLPRRTSVCTSPRRWGYCSSPPALQRPRSVAPQLSWLSAELPRCWKACTLRGARRKTWIASCDRLSLPWSARKCTCIPCLQKEHTSRSPVCEFSRKFQREVLCWNADDEGPDWTWLVELFQEEALTHTYLLQPFWIWQGNVWESNLPFDVIPRCPHVVVPRNYPLDGIADEVHVDGFWYSKSESTNNFDRFWTMIKRSQNR